MLSQIWWNVRFQFPRRHIDSIIQPHEIIEDKEKGICNYYFFIVALVIIAKKNKTIKKKRS